MAIKEKFSHLSWEASELRSTLPGAWIHEALASQLSLCSGSGQRSEQELEYTKEKLGEAAYTSQMLIQTRARRGERPHARGMTSTSRQPSPPVKCKYPSMESESG